MFRAGLESGAKAPPPGPLFGHGAGGWGESPSVKSERKDRKEEEEWKEGSDVERECKASA